MDQTRSRNAAVRAEAIDVLAAGLDTLLVRSRRRLRLRQRGVADQATTTSRALADSAAGAPAPVSPAC